ncbi:hypothetical protein [Sulfurisphaera ohwakuensis]|nr:hypothetical protein [Sulfurisphaera ohwakuensis]
MEVGFEIELEQIVESIINNDEEIIMKYIIVMSGESKTVIPIYT